MPAVKDVKTIYTGDFMEEQQINQLTDQLIVMNQPEQIEKVITMIRTIQNKIAYQAGKQSGYRHGFQSATQLSY